MPIPRQVARFNKNVTTRVTIRIAGWLPGFAIVSHVGRSERRYQTPVNVVRHQERYVFALTYGPHVDWVRNVIAAGGCEIEARRRRVALSDPQRFSDPSRREVAIPARWILGLIDVDEFLALTEVR
jgi:deazaflavin-dependent oxidoreductase (nitroreductase family)